MAKPVVIVLAVLMLVSIVCGGSGNTAAAPVSPLVVDVNITEPTTQQANVTDKLPGFVTFAGTVQVDKLPVERIVVELAATVDTDWPAQISPPTIVFTSTSPQTFTLSVAVPVATRADAVGHVKVTATATGMGYSDTDEATANVTVASYYLMSVVSDAPYQEILPGGATSFTVKVQNQGNSADSYELEIVNARALKEAGWSVELGKSTLTNVPSKGAMEVTVTASSPHGWSWDIWTSLANIILLKATSLGAGRANMTVTQTFSLNAYVKGYNNPLLEMITTLIVLAAVSATIFVVIRRRRKKRMRALAKQEP
jgi:hypothetical protein